METCETETLIKEIKCNKCGFRADPGILRFYESHIQFVSDKTGGAEALEYNILVGAGVAMRMKQIVLSTPDGQQIMFYVDNKADLQWAEMYFHKETTAEQVGSNYTLIAQATNPNGLSKAIFCFIGALLSGIARIYLRPFLGFGSIFIVLSIALIVAGVRNLSTRHNKVYKATCPCCNQPFYFPVDSLGVDCPRCNKRIILKDGTFQSLDT